MLITTEILIFEHWYSSFDIHVCCLEASY